MNKPTLVIGASLKESRYSNICVKTLVSGQFPVAAIGLREGLINKTFVQTGFPELQNIHTVTLYLGPSNQHPFYDYIMKLNPERVIFNPGTENKKFEDLLIANNIVAEENCTLVLLRSGMY